MALVWLLQTAILCFPAALRHSVLERGALKMNASAQMDKSQENEGGCSADEGDDGGVC